MSFKTQFKSVNTFAVTDVLSNMSNLYVHVYLNKLECHGKVNLFQ